MNVNNRASAAAGNATTRKARRARRGMTFAAALATIGAVTVIATSASAVTAAPSRTSASDTLKWAIPAGIQTLDFVKGWGLNVLPADSLALEGLLKFDANGNLQPSLATSWKQINAVTYRYQLRKGVKFWNGHVMTSADVVASLGYVADPKAGSKLNNYWTNVAYVVAKGPYTVQIRLKTADSNFQYTPALPQGWIIEKSFLEAHTADLGRPGVLLMGTGPYKPTNLTPDQSVTFTRNDSYWGPKARYKTIILTSIPSVPTRILALQSGQVDGVSSVAAADAAQFQAVGANVKFINNNAVDFVAFRVDTAPWDDIHVRRTIAYALNRQGLVNSVLNGHGQPANTLPPVGMWAGILKPDAAKALYKSLPTYTFNMAKARAELAQSSRPNGFNTSVVYPDRSPELGKVALSLADNLKPLGINITVTQIPYASWVARVFGHQNLGMEFVAALHSSPSPSVLTNLIANSANTRAGGFNFPNYKNPTVDANLAKFGSATDPAVRATAFGNVLKTLGTDVPFTPIFWLQDGVAMKSGVTFKSFNTQSYYTAWVNAIEKK